MGQTIATRRISLGLISVSNVISQNDANTIFQFFHQRIWQGADLLPERLVGDSDHLG
jgi:hypothetical protein